GRAGGPGVALRSKACGPGAGAADPRAPGLEPRGGAVEPSLQVLALAPGRGLVHGVDLRLRALDLRLLGPPLGVDRLLEVRAGNGRPRRPHARLHRLRALHVDVDMTLLVGGDSGDEALPAAPEVGRQVVRRLVSRQHDYE